MVNADFTFAVIGVSHFGRAIAVFFDHELAAFV
jgi:hypothetical protein